MSLVAITAEPLLRRPPLEVTEHLVPLDVDDLWPPGRTSERLLPRLWVAAADEPIPCRPSMLTVLIRRGNMRRWVQLAIEMVEDSYVDVEGYLLREAQHVFESLQVSDPGKATQPLTGGPVKLLFGVPRAEWSKYATCFCERCRNLPQLVHAELVDA